MRRLLSCALLLAASSAIAQPPGNQQDVVVTGQRIQDYRDRLAACIARHCPPDEDIDATLALAEATFVAGDYTEARRVLGASVGRNRRHAGAYPVPVADLYRARGRVARHLGQENEARLSAVGIMESLRAGLPANDGRQFGARLEYIEMLVLTRNYDQARSRLEALREDARRAGREDVVAMAELRQIWYDYLSNPRGDAKARLAALTESADPAQAMLASGARVLLAAIYRRDGDTRRADALLADTLRRNGGARTMLYEPPYQLAVAEFPDDPAADSVNADNRAARGNFDNAWIDVGFWVQPEGNVTGLELVRRGPAPANWAAPLLRAIESRRYSAGSVPTYRLERYSYTADYEGRTGSHIRQRSRRARVEYFDLSTGAAPPPPGASGTTS